jgi:cysteine desulfuration protein SufE
VLYSFNDSPDVPLKSHWRACRASIDNHAFDVFLAEKLQRVISDFAMFDDPHERLAALVDRTKRIPPLPPGDRIDANRVHGCVSVVWLVSELREGRCYFRSDAESPIVRGLVAFVSDFYDATPVSELATSDVDPLEALDLVRNLSPTRRNGLAATRAAILEFARKSQSIPFGSPTSAGESR